MADFLIGRKEERLEGPDRPIGVKDKVLRRGGLYPLIEEKITFFSGSVEEILLN